MATPWISLTLCTASDVFAEARSLDVIGSASGEQLKMVIEDKIAVAKEQLRIKLMAHLPELFVATASTYGYTASLSSWLGRFGYSYKQLDALLDFLLNPEELKQVAVAYALRAIVVEAMFSANAAFTENGQQLKDLKQALDKACEERMRDALTLLKIDLNKDGVGSEGERVRIKKTIWPV